MPAFGSSVINKSSKRFAPKAPAVRKVVASSDASHSQTTVTAPPASQLSTDLQTEPQLDTTLVNPSSDHDGQAYPRDRNPASPSQRATSPTTTFDDADTERPSKRRRIEHEASAGAIEKNGNTAGENGSRQQSQGYTSISRQIANCGSESLPTPPSSARQELASGTIVHDISNTTVVDSLRNVPIPPLVETHSVIATDAEPHNAAPSASDEDGSPQPGGVTANISDPRASSQAETSADEPRDIIRVEDEVAKQAQHSEKPHKPEEIQQDTQDGMDLVEEGMQVDTELVERDSYTADGSSGQETQGGIEQDVAEAENVASRQEESVEEALVRGLASATDGDRDVQLSNAPSQPAHLAQVSSSTSEEVQQQSQEEQSRAGAGDGAVPVAENGAIITKPRKPRQPRTKKVAPTAQDQTDIVNQPAKTKKPSQPRKKKTITDGTTPAGPKKPSQRGKKKTPLSTEFVTEQDDGEVQRAPAPPTEEPSKPRKKKTTQPVPEANPANPDGSVETSTSVTAEPAPEPAADANPAPARRRGRKRAATPPDAEDHEVMTDQVRMYDLCKDTHLGKKSTREAEMQNIDWTDVAKRRKAAEAHARAGGQVSQTNREDEERQLEAANRQQEGQARGPVLKIINGHMVIDNESLVVRRNNAGGEEVGDAVEESDLTRRVNSHSWLYDARRDPEERYPSAAKSDPWSEEQTDRFYDALRMFGTDFFIISNMFPGKSRRMIKMKFVREERAAPARIRAALIGEQVKMDMGVYLAATGREESEFKDPEVLERELGEMEENQKAEIEAKKAEMADKVKEKQEAAKARAEAGGRGRKKGKKGGGGFDNSGEEILGEG